VIVGVHTPEFAFERVRSNVDEATRSLGVDYPVALDNDYGTWNAWANRYWPAKYFIDRAGHVRFAHFGEGAYAESEDVIRKLLAEPGLPEPVSGSVEGETPSASRHRRPVSATGGSTASTAPGSRATARPTTRSRRRFPPTASGTAGAGRSRRSASWPARMPRFSFATTYERFTSCWGTREIRKRWR
jgi:hypothetical protein